MRKIIFLLGFLAGTAHATDQYYTFNSALGTAPTCASIEGLQGAAPPSCSGNITVSGWFETDGFGKSNYGCGPEGPVFGGKSECPGYNTLLINSDLTLTYQVAGAKVTLPVWFPDGSFPFDVMATSKGLFCLKGCDIENTLVLDSQVFFDINKTAGTASWTFYQAYGTSFYGVDFSDALPNNGLVATYAGTTVPTAAPEMDSCVAGAALTLLIGTPLVLRGRRRG
jgi:hypothetical protein